VAADGRQQRAGAGQQQLTDSTGRRFQRPSRPGTAGDLHVQQLGGGQHAGQVARAHAVA